MSPLDLVNLSALMELTGGRAEVAIGLIDGPVAVTHPDFAGANIREVSGKSRASCSQMASVACKHGTFVASILVAKRGSPAPAICPGCTLLIRPIFTEPAAAGEQIPSTTPEGLATAIIESIEAGARVLNLSAALAQPSPNGQRELEEALDYAARRGVIVVAAAGNQGAIGSTPITRHPWVIPVIACDREGRPIGQSNLGHSIGRRGLMAPGDQITGLGAEGRPVTSGGTSVAAPFVTGAAALLWSAFPAATAVEVKSAVTRVPATRRVVIVPPLLDAWGAYILLRDRLLKEAIVTKHNVVLPQSDNPVDEAAKTTIMPSPPSGAGAALFPQGEGGGCTCGGQSNSNSNGEKPPTGEKTPPTYIFALGRIEMRSPSPGVEKEFAQATGRAETAGLTDQRAAHAVLSQRQNRYLARQLCWVMTIEGVETYILRPTDPADIDLLLESVRHDPRRTDVDLVIGVRGPIAPPEMCNGLMVPIVSFDQIYSFGADELIRSIPRPESMAAEQFEPAARELFDRIMQMADNAGATDEHRALNYLAVRYPAIYSQATEMHARNFSLTAVEVLPSRLSGTRKVVSVVFSFTNRQTDVSEKYFVRVDVTEKFPFLVTKLSPYFER